MRHATCAECGRAMTLAHTMEQDAAHTCDDCSLGTVLRWLELGALAALVVLALLAAA